MLLSIHSHVDFAPVFPFPISPPFFTEFFLLRKTSNQRINNIKGVCGVYNSPLFIYYLILSFQWSGCFLPCEGYGSILNVNKTAQFSRCSSLRPREWQEARFWETLRVSFLPGSKCDARFFSIQTNIVSIANVSALNLPRSVASCALASFISSFYSFSNLKPVCEIFFLWQICPWFLTY